MTAIAPGEHAITNVRRRASLLVGRERVLVVACPDVATLASWHHRAIVAANEADVFATTDSP